MKNIIILRLKLPWPFGEPIDCTTIDKRWKHTTPGTESFADRTHTQHYVQVIAHPTDQMSKNCISKTRHIMNCIIPKQFFWLQVAKDLFFIFLEWVFLQ